MQTVIIKKQDIMNKRIFVLLCIMLYVTIGLFAQSENRNVAKVVVFNNIISGKKDTKLTMGSVLGTLVDAVAAKQVTEDQSIYQESVKSNIIKGLSHARRIKIYDGTGVSQADWYVDGTISNISTTTKVEELKDSKGKTYRETYYKAMIGVTLHVKNASDNSIIMSPTFNVSAEDMAWIETKEGALQKVFEYLSKNVLRYFNRQLPLYANIVEGARDKKDKQKEVYIDLGSATKGVTRDIHFGVYTTKTVAGKEAKKQIGRIKIVDVQGDEISLCKVQSGGKEIKAAIDAGENLLIVSLD